MTSVAVVYHSGYGHTAKQAEAVQAGAASVPGVAAKLLSVNDINRMGSFIGAMAQSDSDVGPDLAPPPGDLATAREYGRRVAEIAVSRRR